MPANFCVGIAVINDMRLQNTFCDAPLSNPRSHNAFTPVGSSSMSSLTSGGRRTKKIFPNLSAPVKHEDVGRIEKYRGISVCLPGTPRRGEGRYDHMCVRQ